MVTLGLWIALLVWAQLSSALHSFSRQVETWLFGSSFGRGASEDYITGGVISVALGVSNNT